MTTAWAHLPNAKYIDRVISAVYCQEFWGNNHRRHWKLLPTDRDRTQCWSMAYDKLSPSGWAQVNNALE